MKGFTAWLKDKLLDLWDDIKRAHTSWTIRFNAGVMPVLMVYWPQIWDALPQFANILPTDKYQTLFAIGTIVNTILRFKTTTALRNKQ